MVINVISCISHEEFVVLLMTVVMLKCTITLHGCDFHVVNVFIRINIVYSTAMPIPVDVQCNAWVCSCSVAGIVGSIPTGGHDCLSVVFVVCCVDSGLCNELIICSEESHRLYVRSRNLNNEAFQRIE